MFVTYFDEVKFDPPKQTSHWIGGVCVSVADIPKLEAAVNSLADEIFGQAELAPETEFHAAHIFQGKGLFKKIDFGARLEILKRLLQIIDQPDVVKKVFIRINPQNIKHATDSPDSICFMYFIEQVEGLLEQLAAYGMVLGDYDDPVIGTSVASLSRFRAGGTSWARSREIKRIVDTVHFAKSHHSRMIQLADIFIYAIQFAHAEPTSSHSRNAFLAAINETGIMDGCRSRTWPLQPVWYRAR